MCDIDAATPAAFGCGSEQEMADRYGIDILRLDDGYSMAELKTLAQKMPIALNASTLEPEEKKELLAVCPDVLFVHNFYPKEDTGLDEKTFEWFCQNVPPQNLAVFIPGDEELRGPLFEGLVTLESDRRHPPYVAFARFALQGIGHILVADPGLSEKERHWMEQGLEGIWPVPCILENPDLYGQVFTIRKDSPAHIRRLQESRGYGKGVSVSEERSNLVRHRGDICQDNDLFGRYSGEITLVNQELPARRRINTLGHVHPDYVDLLDWIGSGKKIQLVSLEERGTDELV